MATLQMPPKRKAVKNQPLAGSPSLSKKAKSAGAAFTARNSTMFGSSGGGRRSKHGKASGGKGQHGVDENAVVEMFDKIADEDDPYVAGMEGISSLCEDLGIDPLEDMRILSNLVL